MSAGRNRDSSVAGSGENVDGAPSTQRAHPIVSTIAFLSGGLTGILAYRTTSAPVRCLLLALGGIAILSVALSGWLGDTDLGRGGVALWVVYSVVLWLVAFGGYPLGGGAASRLGAAAR
ncbi:MAG: hypothetical protein EDQ89_03275 [Acidobacteria bacterium]|nr:MAG: hypothetical protein EDQ89_03275 [Acidobacteriota bacterium]MCL4286886.1 hypothetical protein [Thermoleophilia bacterium]